MKRFLSLSIVVVLATMLLILQADRSQTANDPAIGSANHPIKVLAVKLGTINPQPNDNSKQKINWLEGLEVRIENISGKPIQYLVMHVDVPTGTAAGDFVKVPLAFGQVFTVDSKSGKAEVLQPGARFNLRPSKNVCERIKQLVASGFVPSEKGMHPNLHVAVFEDRTSWFAGRLHYQDPNNPKQWIAAEELARRETQIQPFGMNFLKAAFKPISKSQTCYRYAGFNWQFCCHNSAGDEIYVGNANFLEDPTGNVHPKTVQACCGILGGCCNYDEVGLGCAP